MTQIAYILHSYPFQETSLILDVFTEHHGRISVLARGAKRSKKQAHLFQPFSLLNIDWKGKTDLPILTSVESDSAPILLKRKNLVCGFYLNELLIRLLHRHDPHPEIFDLYGKTIRLLQNSFENESLEIILRRFEKQLLIHLGYGINFEIEINSREPIQKNQYYQINPESGFMLTSSNNPENLRGDHILAFANNDYQSTDILKTAKKIMRILLQPLIGIKPLKSRELL